MTISVDVSSWSRHFTDEDKLDKLCTIVAPVGSKGVNDEREASGPTPVALVNFLDPGSADHLKIHSPLHAFISLLSPSASVSHTVLPPSTPRPSKLVYIQLVQSSGYNPQSTKSLNGPEIRVIGDGQEAVLGEGDGVFISAAKVGEEVELRNEGQQRGEVILFEMDS